MNADLGSRCQDLGVRLSKLVQVFFVCVCVWKGGWGLMKAAQGLRFRGWNFELRETNLGLLVSCFGFQARVQGFVVQGCVRF